MCKVRLTNQALQMIHEDREFQLHLQYATSLKKKIKEARVLLQKTINLLKQIDESLVEMKNASSTLRPLTINQDFGQLVPQS